MVDPLAEVRAFVAAYASSTFGVRVYAGANLPTGYTPKRGAALLLTVRGGEQDYSSQVWRVSVQARCYAETDAQAMAASTALYEAINDAQGGRVMFSRMEDGTLPTPLTEPGPGWPYVLSFYQMHLRVR
jgi:hypothetical protein